MFGFGDESDVLRAARHLLLLLLLLALGQRHSFQERRPEAAPSRGRGEQLTWRQVRSDRSPAADFRVQCSVPARARVSSRPVIRAPGAVCLFNKRSGVKMLLLLLNSHV